MQGEHVKGTSPTTWVVRPDPDLEDLIPSFMQNRKNELSDLDGARERGDYEFVRRLAHTWKGICRPYGFVHLETLSRALEEAGDRENNEDVSHILTEIREYLDNVRVVYES
ncbi:MAG TPA: Hpt domain-containing protein [Bdellovibrionales bacterium]|nr:Hpt domain-containing protein [Bdellovibrionales bacterium]